MSLWHPRDQGHTWPRLWGAFSVSQSWLPPHHLIFEVLEEPRGAAQSTSALLAAPGASWLFALVPFIQLTTSLSHPCALHCRDQSESHAKAAHASLKSSLQAVVFFFPGRFCAQQGWGLGFDSCLQGHSIHQAPLPWALI